jgi:hypothetical protein
VVSAAAGAAIDSPARIAVDPRIRASMIALPYVLDEGQIGGPPGSSKAAW